MQKVAENGMPCPMCRAPLKERPTVSKELQEEIASELGLVYERVKAQTIKDGKYM